MMYDESDPENGDATDDTLTAFEKFDAAILHRTPPVARLISRTTTGQ